MTLSEPRARAGLDADHLIALRRFALNLRFDPSQSALPGGFAVRSKGSGLEIADVREYVPGDDVRHLDSSATARTGRLHVRRFHAERDWTALLVADFRPSMFWGLKRALRSVAAAELLALIGWQVAEMGGRVSLLAFGAGEPVVRPPRGRTRGMLNVIGGLVEAHQRAFDALRSGGGTERPLASELDRAARIAPPGAKVFIASGFDDLGAAFGDQLLALERRRSVSLFQITAAEAARLPRGRYPVRLANGQRARLTLAGTQPRKTEDISDVAGRDALVFDEAMDPEQMARRLAGTISEIKAA